MTARETAVEKAASMKGQRNQVVDIYNTYRPRPRSYIVKYDDMLCATYVSAIFIALDWADIVPPECGAWRLYRNLEAIGCAFWGNDRTPIHGDLMFFGVGKNVTNINHVGIFDKIVDGTYYFWDIRSTVLQHKYTPGTKASIRDYGDILGWGIPNYVSKETNETKPEPVAVFKAGDLVRIKSGATWYSGSTIKSTVFKENWYLIQVKGDRAVIGMNYAQTRNIQSPINVKFLEHVVPVAAEPEEEIKMEVKIALSAMITKETSDKLEEIRQQTGRDYGEIIDSLVAKGAM